MKEAEKVLNFKVAIIVFLGALISLMLPWITHAAPLKTAELSIGAAKKIAAVASSYAEKKSWDVSIAIVNSESNLIYFERADNAYTGSIDAAISKARSANAFRRPTSAFLEGIKSKPGMALVKDVVGLEGGVPIVIKGKFAGAIGVSGARAIEDEEVAKAGADSIEGKKE